MYSKIFPAKLENLYEMLLWISSHCKRAGCKKEMLKKIELASEEALVNVFNHAYKNREGDIILSFFSDQEELKIIIKDKGLLFNPLLEEKKINILAPLEEREEGGLGIIMIKQYMDKVLYERQEPYNVLTLVKKIH